MTGSLMPKMPGIIEILAMLLTRFDWQNKNMAINNERVDPPPPNVAKNESNSLLIILGNTAPAEKAA